MEKTEDNRSIFLSYLFNEELYIIPEKGSPSLASSDQPLYSGNVKKKVLMVFNEHVDGVISAEQEFILKILQSVSLNREEVQIIQNKQYNEKMAMEEDYPVIWGLGLTPKDLGLDPQSESYQIIDQVGKKIILTDPLEEIKTDVKKKKQLWACLKQLFPQK